MIGGGEKVMRWWWEGEWEWWWEGEWEWWKSNGRVVKG